MKNVLVHPNSGSVRIEYRWVEINDFQRRPEIKDVAWEGPPFAPICEWDIDHLPASAKLGSDLVQLGPYLLRRTRDYDPARLAHYWVIVGQGEWVLFASRVTRVLEGAWHRLLLTLAVWGLAAWPEFGREPRWSDVVRRWRKERAA